MVAQKCLTRKNTKEKKAAMPKICSFSKQICAHERHQCSQSVVFSRSLIKRLFLGHCRYQSQRWRNLVFTRFLICLQLSLFHFDLVMSSALKPNFQPRRLKIPHSTRTHPYKYKSFRAHRLSSVNCLYQPD